MQNYNAVLLCKTGQYHTGGRMGSPFTNQDLVLIQFGVLDDLKGHLLDPQEGLTYVMCGDPDQHPEAYHYNIGEITKAGCSDRVHPPAPLGGALRLAPNSPTNVVTPGYDTNIMWDIRTVYEKKGVQTVALYVHAPCAIASMYGMSFQDIIAQAFAAKARIKEEIPGMRVAVFCHIDYQDGRKKSYFVCRSKWAEFHSAAREPYTISRLASEYPDRVTIGPIPPRHLKALAEARSRG
jgi:hypothetical protein